MSPDACLLYGGKADLWQTTNMETTIKREWCPREGQEIPVDLVETDWGWGTRIDWQVWPAHHDIRDCAPCHRGLIAMSGFRHEAV
jgi:hypothetical protein